MKSYNPVSLPSQPRQSLPRGVCAWYILWTRRPGALAYRWTRTMVAARPPPHEEFAMAPTPQKIANLIAAEIKASPAQVAAAVGLTILTIQRLFVGPTWYR